MKTVKTVKKWLIFFLVGMLLTGSVSCYTYADEAAEEAGNEVGNDEQLKILESFVRAPDRRDPIEFGSTIRVPDEVDLEQYDAAYWKKQQKENGIVFQNIYLSDTCSLSSILSAFFLMHHG